MRNTILKNTLFNLLGRFATLIVGFFLIPYLVYKLGPTQFGLWSITLAITGIVGIIDLGISPAIVKFVAEYWSRQSPQQAADSLLSGLLIAFVMALVFIVLVNLLASPIVKRLQVPLNMENLSRDLLRAASIILGIAYLSNCLQSALAGLQRMELVNGINIISSISGAMISFLCLELGWGLRGLILSHAFAAISALLLGMLSVVRLISPQIIRRSRPRFQLMRAMFGYGWKIQISNTCGLIIPLMNKFLTSAFAGLNRVAVFEIGNRITNYSNSLPIAFFTALVPAWTESSVKLDENSLKEKYHRYIYFFFFVSIPFIFIPICCAKPIILAWVGKGFDSSVWVAQILLVGYGVNLQTGIGTSLLRGIGKPELEMFYGLLTLGANAFLSIFLAKKFGFIGLLIGVSMAQIVGSVSFFMFIRPIVGPHRRYTETGRLLVNSLLPAIVMLALNHLEWPISWGRLNRASILALLIIEVMIYFVLYLMLSWRNPALRGLMEYGRALYNNQRSLSQFKSATFSKHIYKCL